MSILDNLVINRAAVLSGSYINMNTLFYVVIALAVLLLIAIVYLINIMSYLKNNSADKAENSSADHVTAQAAGNNQGELVQDGELVAVITAAIYASMGGNAPADGFVVRSIRKAR